MQEHLEFAFFVPFSACPPQTKLSFLDCKMVGFLLQLIGLWAESDQSSPEKVLSCCKWNQPEHCCFLGYCFGLCMIWCFVIWSGKKPFFFSESVPLRCYFISALWFYFNNLLTIHQLQIRWKASLTAPFLFVCCSPPPADLPFPLPFCFPSLQVFYCLFMLGAVWPVLATLNVNLFPRCTSGSG